MKRAVISGPRSAASLRASARHRRRRALDLHAIPRAHVRPIYGGCERTAVELIAGWLARSGIKR